MKRTLVLSTILGLGMLGGYAMADDAAPAANGPAANTPAVGPRQGGAAGAIREKRMEARKRLAEHLQEAQAFRATLKDMTPEQRQEAIKKHVAEQYAKATAAMAKKHQERMAALDKRLGNAQKLTDAQKQEIKAFAEKQYQERTAFVAKQHDARMAGVAKIMADTSLQGPQKGKALRELAQTLRASGQEFHKTQMAENRAMFQKYHPGAGNRPQRGGKKADAGAAPAKP